MEMYPAIDSEGRDLRIGDWVRVIAVPVSIQGMPAESLEAFSKAVGHTFQIEGFDAAGCLHLDMYAKISCDSIYINCLSTKEMLANLWKATMNGSNTVLMAAYF